MTLSADGASIALVSAEAPENQIKVVRSQDLAQVAVIGMGTKKVVGLQWADADHLLVVTENTAKLDRLAMEHRRRWWLPALIDIRTGKMTELLAFDQSQGTSNATEALDAVADMPQPRTVDGKVQIFLPGYSLPQGTTRYVLTMFRHGYGVGGPRVVATGTVLTDTLLIDREGRAAAREDYDSETGRWSLWLRPTAGWRKSRELLARLDPPSLEGFGPGEDSVIVSNLEDGRIRYRQASIASRAWSEPIAMLDDMDPVVDAVRQVVLGGVDSGHLHLRYAFLSPDDGKLWAGIEQRFPGETVEWVSWSDDRSKVVVHVQGTTSGDAYDLLDLRTHRIELIGEEYRDIHPEEIGEVRAISYAAADGTAIPAFLTIPKGAPARGLPLVVLVHGGPSAHDKPGFNWWSQALASLGYAVLQPQYRGSDGFGHPYVEAGYGQWGRRMQTDLSDGVHSLAAQGIVDPSRVCIVGDSYGGYAAMAGVTLQSGLYRCAVSVSGVSDLRRLLVQTHTDMGSRSLTMRYWQRFMGARSASDPVLDDISPARHADRLSAPLLLIHGDLDTIVQPEQSRIMQAAAARAGKAVQLVMLKGEDHNLARSATRLEMLRAMAEFLHANLPTDAAGATSAR